MGNADSISATENDLPSDASFLSSPLLSFLPSSRDANDSQQDPLTRNAPAGPGERLTRARGSLGAPPLRHLARPEALRR